MSQRERKRDKEKLRRDDLKDAIERLHDSLLQHDDNFRSESERRASMAAPAVRTARSIANSQEHLAFTKVEIVNQAIFTIQTTATENEALKAMTTSSDSATGNSQSALEVASKLSPVFHQGVGPVSTNLATATLEDSSEKRASDTEASLIDSTHERPSRSLCDESTVSTHHQEEDRIGVLVIPVVAQVPQPAGSSSQNKKSGPNNTHDGSHGLFSDEPSRHPSLRTSSAGIPSKGSVNRETSQSHQEQEGQHPAGIHTDLPNQITSREHTLLHDEAAALFAVQALHRRALHRAAMVQQVWTLTANNHVSQHPQDHYRVQHNQALLVAAAVEEQSELALRNQQTMPQQLSIRPRLATPNQQSSTERSFLTASSSPTRTRAALSRRTSKSDPEGVSASSTESRTEKDI